MKKIEKYETVIQNDGFSKEVTDRWIRENELETLT